MFAIFLHYDLLSIGICIVMGVHSVIGGCKRKRSVHVLAIYFSRDE